MRMILSIKKIILVSLLGQGNSGGQLRVEHQKQKLIVGEEEKEVRGDKYNRSCR